MIELRLRPRWALSSFRARATRPRPTRAAERTRIRVVQHCGGRPELVALGGLVPQLLFAGSGYDHAGTTGDDVRADLEIALRSLLGQNA